MIAEQPVNGPLQIWLLNDSATPKTTAVEFFTGKTIPVTVPRWPDGEPMRQFIDSRGKRHLGLDSPRSYSKETPFNIYDFNDGHRVAKLLIVKNYDSTNVTLSALGAGSSAKNLSTIKFPIIRWQSGELRSDPYTPWLSLDDNTALITIGCFVFRLRTSDLTPVGNAPSLHLVDNTTLQAIGARPEVKSAKNPTQALTEALKIPTDDAHSCPPPPPDFFH